MLSLRPTWLIFQQSHKYMFSWGCGWAVAPTAAMRAAAGSQFPPNQQPLLHPPLHPRDDASSCLLVANATSGHSDGVWHFDSLTRARWWPGKDFAASYVMSPVGLDPELESPSTRLSRCCSSQPCAAFSVSSRHLQLASLLVENLTVNIDVKYLWSKSQSPRV